MMSAVFSLSTMFTIASGYRFSRWAPNSGFTIVWLSGSHTSRQPSWLYIHPGCWVLSRCPSSTYRISFAALGTPSWSMPQNTTRPSRQPPTQYVHSVSASRARCCWLHGNCHSQYRKSILSGTAKSIVRRTHDLGISSTGGGGGVGRGGGGVQFTGTSSTSTQYFRPSHRIASGKVMRSAFIRNCTGPPFASHTKHRYVLPWFFSEMVDGLTMKLPSCLSSWNGQMPVMFTPALRSVTNSPTTSSILARSITARTTSSRIFGIIFYILGGVRTAALSSQFLIVTCRFGNCLLPIFIWHVSIFSSAAEGLLVRLSFFFTFGRKHEYL